MHPAGKFGGERVLPGGLEQEKRLGRKSLRLQATCGLVQDRLHEPPEIGQDPTGVRLRLLSSGWHGRHVRFKSQIVQEWNYTAWSAGSPPLRVPMMTGGRANDLRL